MSRTLDLSGRKEIEFVAESRVAFLEGQLPEIVSIIRRAREGPLCPPLVVGGSHDRGRGTDTMGTRLVMSEDDLAAPW